MRTGNKLSIICQRCDKEYKTQKGYDNHIGKTCYLRCKHCGAKFKTDRGKANHKCSFHPDKVKARNQADKDAEAARIFQYNEREQIIKDILSGNPDLPFKIGDKYFYVYEQIIKPTHEKRFNRMVRVRYEAVKSFRSVGIVVDSISINPPSYIKNSEIPLKWKDWIFINDRVLFKDLMQNEDECKLKAQERQKKYDADCEFASFCR